MKFKFYSKYKLKMLDPKRYPIIHYNNNKFLFIHINKTAGTSINTALNKIKLHLTVKEVISLIGEREFNQAITFSVCRNPYNRIYSMYRHRERTNQCNMKSHPIPFNDWIERCFSNDPDYFYRNPQLKMFATQVSWLKDNREKIRVENFIRFERLSQEWRAFAGKFGLPLKLDSLNASGQSIKPLRELYNSRSIQLIKKEFQEDFNFFSYDSEPK